MVREGVDALQDTVQSLRVRLADARERETNAVAMLNALQPAWRADSPEFCCHHPEPVVPPPPPRVVHELMIVRAHSIYDLWA